MEVGREEMGTLGYKNMNLQIDPRPRLICLFPVPTKTHVFCCKWAFLKIILFN